MSDEPEVQHLSGCEHPVAPCTCPRGYLINEARRIREMYLFAEEEFTRENRRAVDLKIERDRLRTVVDAARAYRDIMLRDEVEDGWLKRTNKAAEALFAALVRLDGPTGEDT